MGKQEKKQRERNIKSKICDALEISSDLLSDIPRFTINDNCELWVEKYKSVLEYEENRIRLAAKKYEICISGKNLTIVCITDEQIFIRGRFTGFEYIY